MVYAIVTITIAGIKDPSIPISAYDCRAIRPRHLTLCLLPTAYILRHYLLYPSIRLAALTIPRGPEHKSIPQHATMWILLSPQTRHLGITNSGNFMDYVTMRPKVPNCVPDGRR